MTPADVIAKLFPVVDADRIQKAKGMAQRGKLDWARVLAAMTEDQRRDVDHASVPTAIHSESS